MMTKLEIPIAIIIYNRDAKFRKLLHFVSKVRPSKMYIIADGPKSIEDKTKVEKTRNVLSEINWDCEIIKVFSDVNLGLRNRVVSGLDYVFKKEEFAIILEDDLIPSEDFFHFTEELLYKYKNDSRVFSICGSNLFGSVKCNNDSYFFSKYTNSWGWATWRRAWSNYNHDVSNVQILKSHRFFHYLRGSRSELYWKFIFKQVDREVMDSWAYRWMLSCWLNNGLNIVPSHNIVQNGGADEEATHTNASRFYLRNSIFGLKFPLNHPKFMCVNTNYDLKCEDYIYSKSLMGRIKWIFDKFGIG